ncbi:hypothetical protein, partial [Micromonospora echinofusca]|uniref:hypothetical protein n=1 Tax=Micromonospora echinofusca TaxID=47858 RepID=UPI0033E74226
MPASPTPRLAGQLRRGDGETTRRHRRDRRRPAATGGDRRRPAATGGDRRRPAATGGDRRR